MRNPVAITCVSITANTAVDIVVVVVDVRVYDYFVVFVLLHIALLLFIILVRLPSL